MAVATQEKIEVSFGAVSAELREKNHKALQPVLFDLIAFARVLKQLHWNVIGAHFKPIHLTLDEIYADVEIATDTVAERIAATGHSPNGRIRDVSSNSEIGDVPEGFTRDSEVLLLAEHRTKQVVEFIRDHMDEIEEVDPVTADILHQICATLEKHHWMLQAQRV
jgi:starvation-inducible DNA-binding protein